MKSFKVAIVSALLISSNFVKAQEAHKIDAKKAQEILEIISKEVEVIQLKNGDSIDLRDFSEPVKLKDLESMIINFDRGGEGTGTGSGG